MPETLNHIPGSLKWPLLGDTLGFLTRPVALFNEKQRQYGNIFKMRMLGRTMVFMVGADANKLLLIDQAQYASSYEGWQFSIGELFRGGLMLRDGDDHKHHRSLLQTVFKKEPMANYLGIMEPIVQRALREWAGKSTTGSPEMVLFPAIKALTLELAGSVFFNIDFSGDLSRINQAIVDLVASATTLVPFNLPFTQYRRGMQGRKVLQDYFGKIVEERRKSPAGDMISLLCAAEAETTDQANSRKLTDTEIVDHLIFFLMAAHDTTASTLTSMIHQLAVHPAWQETLRTECFSNPSEGPLDTRQLAKLEKIGYVMQETIRLHPPLMLIPRQTTQPMTYEGVEIPAHSRVTVLLYHNHTNPTYWTNPEQFDPLRFAPQRNEHRKCPHAYAPFGAGQHYCLGFAFAEMQVKLVMYHLLTTYQWSLPAHYKAQFADIPIRHPKDGLRLNVYPLTNTPG